MPTQPLAAPASAGSAASVDASNARVSARPGNQQPATARTLARPAAAATQAPQAEATPQADKARIADRHQLRQRSAIDAYQNALTPPPAGNGH
ncbi:hypothetical protein ACXU4B_01710 [Dyella soli]|uniref:Uncharacterized protein n=1 Tax=Dyella soli TaxID=522319 RepID=A0A4R0YLR4_9GAMM|nr:hypothetical protein [Dyella soli]TCI09787.1 hypothetical protein EZM97_12575 [Dyella soli]